MRLRERLYYYFKPLIPRDLRIELRRAWAKRIAARTSNVWPIDPWAKESPLGWAGWPKQKRFALILTHDVENSVGLSKVYEVMKLEEDLGFRSSFNFVPEGDYRTPDGMRHALERRGFEVGIHDLKHDGKLYNSRHGFQKKAYKINNYLREWNAVGFRSAFMHHNLEWLHDLNVAYDSSTFDSDVFEPQPDGVRTIFPFCCSMMENRAGYVELPCTLPQDSTLFLILQERTIDIWKRKIDWIAHHGGMALLNTHPDYMCFSGAPRARSEFPAEMYRSFLQYVKERYAGAFWHVLPRQAASFYNQWAHQTRPLNHRQTIQVGSPNGVDVIATSSNGGSIVTLATLSSLVDPVLRGTANFISGAAGL